ncbi:MAG: ABC transporter substrate-binding protein [Polyangiales bacterium]
MTSAPCAARLASVALLLFACSKEPPAPAPAAKKHEAPGAATSATAPLRVAYSDWPGWVAWEIAIQKGWFAEEGVAVDFKWFEYVPSMEAYSAGKVDAVTMTNGDMLVTGASGAKSVAILINDYSNGNDMVVAQPAIKSVAALKGKQVGVEVGFVSHLLLIKALESAGLKDTDVQLVNVPTDQTPQLLRAGEVSAIVAWQPNSGQALKEAAGSHPVYTSADAPGLIYDLLCVSPKSLSERRADWSKVAKVWFRIADYLQKPENLDEAAKIMAARVGMEPSAYRPLIGGTRFLGLSDNRARFKKGDSLESLHHSTEVVDAFQAKNGIYKSKVAFAEYLDGSLVAELPESAPTGLVAK